MLNWLRCIFIIGHRWKLSDKVCAKPLNLNHVKGASDLTASYLTQGKTTLIYTCDFCRSVKVIECVGVN